MSATSQSVAMQREIDTKTFNPLDWHHAKVKERLLKNMLQKWMDQIEQEVNSGELSYGTLHAYRSRAKSHVIPLLGDKDVREIGFPELEEFKDSLPRSIKIKTRKNILNDLRTAFRWMHRKGIIAFVPPFPVIKGNDTNEKIALSIEDQQGALDKIPDRHKDVFRFEFELGIRPGETCALKIKDIDFKQKTVKICRTFTMRRIRENDKEGHRKTIPISSLAFSIAEEKAHGRFPEDWLFVNPDTGRNYTVQYLGKWWRLWTGLPCSHYEGTRHSFCTQIAEISDESAAQALMRHADNRSTQKYTHHRTEYLRDVLSRRGNIRDLTVKEKKQ